MKAKRRHDLQTNTLAKVITNAPTWWSENGTKTVFIIVAALVVGFLIRYRISSSREHAIAAAQNLAGARTMIADLRDRYMPWSGAAPEQLMGVRHTIAAEASTAIENAMNEASDPRIKAESLIARGDLNWLQGTFPDLPGAATQPALRSNRSREDFLGSAAESYQSVLDSYPTENDAVIAAHFGLAAIAEDRSKWDEAKKHYDAVAGNADAAEAYKVLAQERLTTLETIQRPVLIVAATRPTTVPSVTTMPAVTPTTAGSAKPQAATSTAPPAKPQAPPAPVPAVPATLPSGKTATSKP